MQAMSHAETVAVLQAHEAENLALGEGEFVERFVTELVRVVGPTCHEEGDPEPQSTAEYARSVAPSYHEDEVLRRDGPEECARADYSYWGE